MIKWLDKNKKSISVIMVVISCFIALPLIVSGNTDKIVIASVILAIVLSIAVALYTKGVPLAAMILSYVCLMTAGIAVAIVLQLFLPLPKNIDKNIITSIVTGVVILFTVVIPLPKEARYKAMKILQPEDDDEASHKQITEQSTYQQYIIQKGANRYIARPYALENLPPLKKKIRIISSLLLCGIGFLGFLISSHWEDEVAYFLHSYSFWCCTISFLVLLLGGALLIVGLIRALIVTATVAGVGALAIWIGLKLVNIYHQSVMKFIILLILIIILIIFTSIVIYKLYRVRTAALNLTTYDKDGTCITADLALSDLLPISGYTQLISCRLSFEPQKGVNVINEIVAQITSWSNWKKLIFSGYVIESPNIETLILTFYIYTNRDCSDLFQKRLSTFGCKSLEVDCRKDSEWSAYNEKLYPDRYILNTIGNRNLSAYLEQTNYDFNEPITLVYTLIFESEDDALKCTEAATQAGYILAQYQSNVEHVLENDLPEKYSYIVYIQNECKAGLEQLNAQTRRIMDFAEIHNGELQDFDIGELEEDQTEMSE